MRFESNQGSIDRMWFQYGDKIPNGILYFSFIIDNSAYLLTGSKSNQFKVIET